MTSVVPFGQASRSFVGFFPQEGSRLMKPILTLAASVVALAAWTSASEAAYGWPPPGYSPTGISAHDDHQYKGLCARWRAWKQRRQCCATTISQPVDETPPAVSTPAAPTAPQTLPAPRPIQP